MLDKLITSRTRVKLLLKFFSNASNCAYLRELADEFGESTNSVRLELNRLKQAGLLESKPSGNTVLYRANPNSPLFPELRNMVGKYLGFDRILENVIRQIGDLEAAFISGAYAEGKDSGVIDLILVGNINRVQLYKYIDRTEEMINRKVRPLILTSEEFESHQLQLLEPSHIVLWGHSKSSP